MNLSTSYGSMSLPWVAQMPAKYYVNDESGRFIWMSSLPRVAQMHVNYNANDESQHFLWVSFSSTQRRSDARKRQRKQWDQAILMDEFHYLER